MNNKPLGVRVDEFNSSIVGIINDSGIPPYIITLILKNILTEIEPLGVKQIEKEYQQYYQSMEDNTEDENDLISDDEKENLENDE